MAGREEIATEQRSGMDDANQAMKDFKKESSDEKQLVDKDVKDKVKTENESAEKSLTDAEKECADRKKKDEEEAARKKKEIEEKEKDESWWDSIKSAVKKAVKALTNLVKDIFDKLRKFVKETIEKARKWAVELVEKCRKWVVDKIDGFRKWLKDKVNKYVGEYFPGLAKRVAPTIPAFVMLKRNGSAQFDGWRRRDRHEVGPTQLRVQLDNLTLLFGKGSRFVQQLRLKERFADIVQLRRTFDQTPPAFRPPTCNRNKAGKPAHQFEVKPEFAALGDQERLAAQGDFLDQRSRRN